MDIRSNIPLRLKEFPRAKPERTPEGKGVYNSLQCRFQYMTHYCVHYSMVCSKMLRQERKGSLRIRPAQPVTLAFL